MVAAPTLDEPRVHGDLPHATPAAAAKVREVRPPAGALAAVGLPPAPRAVPRAGADRPVVVRGSNHAETIDIGTVGDRYPSTSGRLVGFSQPGDHPYGEAVTEVRLPDPDHLPQGADKARAVRAMFDTIAPRYDLVNRIMTFGMDRGWRRRAVRELGLPAGSLVLDLASGTGDLCRELGRRGLVGIGTDLSLGMLVHARTTAALTQADALALPHPGACLDGVVSGFALRNFADLSQVFAELGRVVRSGGRIALLDVAEPANPLLRLGHRVYFGRVVPLIGGALSDRSAYRYLPKSVAYLPAPEAMLADLRAHGFEAVERTLLSGGITQLITATRTAS